MAIRKHCSSALLVAISITPWALFGSIRNNMSTGTPALEATVMAKLCVSSLVTALRRSASSNAERLFIDKASFSSMLSTAS